jgi:ribosome biogenesis SPOUT family RNA methylase Rps3
MRRLTKRERYERNKTAGEILQKSLDDESLPWITIDCSFNHIMTEFERTSLVVQIQESYSHLRKHAKFGRMCVCSVDDELQNKIRKQGGNEWVIRTSNESLEKLNTENVIIMSPDAERELSVEDLKKPNNMFVIGGIVDRLVSRNETAHKAIKLGLESRRLPVNSDQVKNKVFNIDSVFLFLLRCLEVISRGESLSRDGMVEILAKVLPERKKKDTSLKPEVGEKRVRNEVQDPCNTVKLETYRILDLFS